MFLTVVTFLYDRLSMRPAGRTLQDSKKPSAMEDGPTWNANFAVPSGVRVVSTTLVACVTQYTIMKYKQ